MPTTYPTLNYTPPTTAFDTSTPAGVSAITNYINQLNRAGQRSALGARIPGGSNLENLSSQHIGTELRAEVDPYVQRLLGQAAAARGASTGQGPGGPNTMASYLQALGLTGMELQRQGETDLTAALGRNPAAPLFDPTTQMLTPYQSSQLRLQAAEANLRAQQEAQRLQLERERLATEADAARSRFQHASGPTGTTTRTGAAGGGTGLEGFGGEYVARSLGGGGGGLNIPYDPFSTADWWNSIGAGGARPSTGGTSTFYAGSAGGYQDPSDWMHNFENDMYGPGSTGGTTTTLAGTDPGAGLGLDDFLYGGMIGSDAPPTELDYLGG